MCDVYAHGSYGMSFVPHGHVLPPTRQVAATRMRAAEETGSRRTRFRSTTCSHRKLATIPSVPLRAELDAIEETGCGWARRDIRPTCSTSVGFPSSRRLVSSLPDQQPPYGQRPDFMQG